MEIGLRKRWRGLDAFIVFRVPAWILADVQTNGNISNVHVQWFSCWKIRVDDCDIHEMTSQGSLVLLREGTIKGDHNQTSGLSSGSSDTKSLGLLMSHRPSTLAILVPLMEQSITRMDCVICLSICMYPDLSGELLVSVTSCLMLVR